LWQERAMTEHPQGAGGGGPRATTEHPQAPERRPAITVDGREISHAELTLAAEVSRFPARLGLKVPLNGFLAWRAYTVVRALWRVSRRFGRRA
jgi:hypothetical protein